MMTRISPILLFFCYMLILVCAIHAQETEFTNDNATIRGQVIDITPEQKPIEGVTVKIVNSATSKEYIVTTNENGEYVKTGLPAGRYTIAVSKKGYSDRSGKSRVVVPGGEIYDRIEMRRIETLFTFFQKHFFTWQSLIGFAVVFLFVLILISLRSRV